tara:strand:+ start:100 stop:1059 length:960 start_codon:yes stop_codon:yes gene_type:complete
LNNKNINKIINQVVDIQLDAVHKLKETFDNNFNDIIRFLSKISGRIVISGIGKSAIISMKISSTLNSTGTPSIFMHGSDALHGDLGAITKDDVLIYISKSGSNSDTVDLVNSLKKNGVDIVSITANKDSYLAKNSRYIIHTPIDVEACPNNLAPTTSTGIQLLVGDIIAVCLMTLKNFDETSFAKLHPSGSLGKKLTTTVEDLIDTQNTPFIDVKSKFSDAINEISNKMLGATAVLDNGQVVGIITDGDVRRILEKNTDPLNIIVSNIISRNPKTVKHSLLAIDALHIMNHNKITNLIVTKDNNYIGMLHIHDIVNAGL